MLIEVGAIFLRLHELQRRAVGSSKALDKFVKFDVGAAITSKEVDFASCFELS